jgi:hypothetical protein
MKKVGAAVIAALFFAGILSARLTSHSQPAVSPCSTQSEMRNVGGLKFEIRRVDCDTFAKDASVSVLVVTAGKDRTEIFKYEPDERNPLPVISITPDRHILISVPSVASIYSKADNWHGTTIEYNIGAVYYR